MSLTNLGLSIEYYEPWVRGKAFIGTIGDALDSYNHTLGADWLYKSASIGFSSNANNSVNWLIDGLGRHILVKNPGGIVVFSGFVNSISANFGGISYTIGPLNEIANRVLATYTSKIQMQNYMVDAGQIETVIAQYAPSQLVYGIWEKIVSAGECVVDPSTGYNEAEKARDLFLETFKIPKVIINSGSMGGADIRLTLDISGYAEWLSAFVYQNRLYTGAVAGLITATAKIQAALADDPNGIFSTDYGKMQANASLQADKEENYKTAKTVIENAVKVGDGTNRWLLWLNEDNRISYFPMSKVYSYLRQMTQNVQQFFDYNTEAMIEPWDVLPGKFYFIRDTPLGLAGTDIVDFRKGFIEEVRFTAPYSVDVSGEPFNQFQVYVNQKAGGSF